MALLTHQSFANDKTPYWLSNPVEYLRFAGTPPVDVSAAGGELYANGVSMSPASWWNYPANGTVMLDPSGDVLQIIGNDLYFNNQLLAIASNISNVSDWYLYPAVSGNVELNAGVGIDFDGRLLNRVGNDLFFGGVNLNSSNWSSYPALQNVAMGGYSLCNVAGMSASSNFTANVSSNYVLNARTVKNVANSSISNECTSFNVVTDTINPAASSAINLTATNGTGGQVNILANSSVTGSLGGRISLTAEGGNTGGLVYGGEIDITANTGGVLPTGFTSAIKLSAASVLSYAGVVPPIGSVAGFNFVYGTGGVNIVAGTPPVLPNVPGSVYLSGDIGLLGSAGGVRIARGAAIDFITPLPLSGNLKIRGNPAGDKVELSNVASLGMEGDITGLGSISMTGNIGGVSTIVMGGFGAISNVNTINGFPYNPVRNWANFPAIANVDMSANSISNVSNVVFRTVGQVAPAALTATPGFGGFDPRCVGTVNSLSFADGGMFRCSELLLNSSDAASNDMRLVNISNAFDAKNRILVQSGLPEQIVAYLSDIPMSHGTMSSTLTQGMTASNVPRVLTYNTFGTLVGITESAGKVYSTNGGSYIVTFSIQFNRLVGGTATIVEAWVRYNGNDIPNSSSRVLIPGGAANNEVVLTVPINVEMAAGSYVEIVYATTDWTDTKATAFPARTTPWIAPAVPSIILNMDEVG